MSALSSRSNAFFPLLVDLCVLPLLEHSPLSSSSSSSPLLCCVRLNPQKHEGQLSVMQLMDMLTGVVSGMKYLTEMGFVHKRLAAHKVREAGRCGRVHSRRKEP